MTIAKPNFIVSTFPKCAAQSMDLVLRRVLEDIGYHITPFGIEGSARITTEVAGKHDPYYHWTHAHPGLFTPFLGDQNYRFIYQYRDPRDSVVSWTYNEISEGNISGNIDRVREKIMGLTQITTLNNV